VRQIDMERWPRRQHFDTFAAFQFPHFAMCADVDLTAFRPAVEAVDASFTAAIVYVISRAANDIPEFRYRIRDDIVVEHEVVHPSTTILVDDDRFSFCMFDYVADFGGFAGQFASRIAEVKEHPTLADPPGRDDLLYMTAIPWVAFTSFAHPMPTLDADSIPRFAWGRYSDHDDSVKMPLSVQGHHGLMDGLHMGRYYQTVQAYLDRPDFLEGS
jgi:chloramphenicol O-acetyltransferase type A